MIRSLIRKMPALYNALLYGKHKLLLLKTKSAFSRYVAEAASPKLQLGAGSNVVSGWFNTDYFNRPSVYFLDATKEFPFPSDVFSCIFTEHQIEHISYNDALFMLQENYRTLKPGGIIKIITPDLKQYVQHYINGELTTDLIKQHVNNWIYGGFHNASNYIPVDDYYDAHFVNDIFLNYEHRFLYDDHALSSLLLKAGFTDIKNGEGDYPEFAGIGSHVSEFDKLFNLTLTAKKPK